MNTGMIFDIKRYAINDGPGIRTAVFFKGCPLACWWCHNPEGQSFQPQLIVRSNRCKSIQACLQVCPQDAITWDHGPITDWKKCDDCGKCAEICYAGARELVGRQVSINELVQEVSRDVPFYDQSGGGVTFTGGEPLHQIEFLKDALLACKKNNIHTAVDTSGHSSWENIKSILPLVDLFLYDLKFMDAKKHLQYTGVSNRLILTNLRMIAESRAHIVVRIPLIPGINDNEENLDLCASFLSKLAPLDGVSVMPYHDIGVTKYQALGIKYRLEVTKSPNDEQIGHVEELFSRYQLPVIKHSRRAV